MSKILKLFFSQEKFDSSTLNFSTLYPNFIHILLIHCVPLAKEILLIPKITSPNVKNVSEIPIFIAKCFKQ